jgi:hypothetical protein
MKESHMIWARVSSDRQLLVPLAPERYEPVVEVFLHGRAEAIAPSFVQSTKDGWIRIQATDNQPGEDQDEKWHHTHSLIHAHQSAVARVEVVFRKERAGGPIGFSYGPADEEPGLQAVVS